MTLSFWTFVCQSVSFLEKRKTFANHCFFLIVDGETAARMIKSTNNKNRDTPIIAVTAYERTVQLAGAFDDILSKPVTKAIISQKLKQFCEAGEPVLPLKPAM